MKGLFVLRILIIASMLTLPLVAGHTSVCRYTGSLR